MNSPWGANHVSAGTARSNKLVNAVTRRRFATLVSAALADDVGRGLRDSRDGDSVICESTN